VIKYQYKKMKLSIGAIIYQAVNEQKWLDINYDSKDGKFSRFWFALKDIDFDKDKLYGDIFNYYKSAECIENPRPISRHKIKSVKLVEGSFYDPPQALIDKIEQNKEKIARKNSKKYPYLNKWLRKIDINTEEALKTIETEYQNNIETGKENAIGRKIFTLGAVSRIKAGEIYIKVNKTNFRLDSNVTNLPKELLKHITINGKHLIEIDITNSQPFFSSGLFNPTPEVEQIMVQYLGEQLTMIIKSLHLSEKEDVILYCSLVEQGNFYKHMMERFRQNNIPFKDRGDVKTQLFIVFFGKSNADKYNQAARLFSTEFPHVAKLFNLIKAKNNNRLAILLQRIEAYVILEKVALRISEEMPQLPFLTKHDSIMPFKLSVITSGSIKRVKNIITDTISKTIGAIPPGRMKRFI